MKRSVIVIPALLSFMLFISCTKEQTCTVTEKNGVKTYRNNNIPTVEKLDFNPVKKFTLNNDTSDVNYISYSDFDLIGIDSEENIFIADVGKPRVNKYDKEGQFLETFVKQGLGPGELNSISFLTIKNDTLYLGDRETGTVSRFKSSGEFIDKFKPNSDAYQVKPVGKNKFICFTINYKQVDNGWLIIYELALLNNSFETLKTFNKLEFLSDDMNNFDLATYLTVTDDKIYVAVNDKMLYKINVYDHNGNFIEEIYKNYAAIAFTEEEFNKMINYLKKTDQGELDKNSMRKKRAIVGMFSDKNGNIIVQPAVDTSKGNTEGMVLDFFNKENVYMNTYILKTDKPYYQCDYNTFINFKGNKMYKYDTENSILEAYEY